MTNKEKFEANEEKEQRILLSRGLCEHCKKRCGDIPQLAHRIPKGYVTMYGKEIIHHRLNMILVYSLKCNAAVLLSPAAHPLESEELIKTIREDLNE